MQYCFLPSGTVVAKGNVFTSVCLFTGEGACVVKGDMHGEGGHAWQRGMCVAGDMHGKGACIAGGHA